METFWDTQLKCEVEKIAKTEHFNYFEVQPVRPSKTYGQYADHLKPMQEHKINLEILKKSMDAYNKQIVPGQLMVGCVVKIGSKIKQVNKIYGDIVQLGGDSNYLSECGGLLTSGCFDDGVNIKYFRDTGKKHKAQVWFFDQGESGAHRGVYFEADFPLWEYTGDIASSEENTYLVRYLPPEKRERGEYAWSVCQGINCVDSFRKEEDLLKWLDDRGLTRGKGFHEDPKSYWVDGIYEERHYIIEGNQFKKEFGHLRPVKVHGNGNYYVLGYAQKVERKIVIHYQNPNSENYLKL
ncbi:hypothetical protein OAH77_04520 [Flavobacteriaceae bacterium]|nr:hypothetical protein [Flavobacteriaceae bacterium]